MNRPSFQFYPADWIGNANLRRCSHAEKGVWVDVMCLMHDAPEYGILRWPLQEIAQAVSCKAANLRALVDKTVMKGDDDMVEPLIYVPRSGGKDGNPVTLVLPQSGPVWYSSRMVRDEYVRQHRGESSRFGSPKGGNPASLKGQPKGGNGASVGDCFGYGSSSSSSSSALTPPSQGQMLATECTRGPAKSAQDIDWEVF